MRHYMSFSHSWYLDLLSSDILQLAIDLFHYGLSVIVSDDRIMLHDAALMYPSVSQANLYCFTGRSSTAVPLLGHGHSAINSSYGFSSSNSQLRSSGVSYIYHSLLSYSSAFTLCLFSSIFLPSSSLSSIRSTAISTYPALVLVPVLSVHITMNSADLESKVECSRFR